MELALARKREQEERRRREEDLAFARKKRDEERRLESLRLEQEAAVALARANAIEEELGFKREEDEQHHLDLPEIDPSQRVQHFSSTLNHMGQALEIYRMTSGPLLCIHIIKRYKSPFKA